MAQAAKVRLGAGPVVQLQAGAVVALIDVVQRRAPLTLLQCRQRDGGAEGLG